jgi:crossover junction endodeoxyribonuclease RuvC
MSSMPHAHETRAQHPYRGLGLDPGLAATGFAVVGCLQRGGSLSDWGAITTRAGEATHLRLLEIYGAVRALIDQWRPDVIAVEDVYVLDRYPRAAIQLGEVKGVIALAAAEAHLEFLQVKPAEIKRALTGNGRAPKQQVHAAVQRSLGLSHGITPDHASDAAAIALMALSRTGHYIW